MDTLATINAFIARYQTLVIATESEKQPLATRIFFVEDPASSTTLKLYGALIGSSRKLANLIRNPRVGIYIGPDQPSTWLEATAYARILTEETDAAAVRARLAQKSAVAGTFLARVPTVAVELDVNWLRITDLTGGALSTELTFQAGES